MEASDPIGGGAGDGRSSEVMAPVRAHRHGGRDGLCLALVGVGEARGVAALAIWDGERRLGEGLSEERVTALVAMLAEAVHRNVAVSYEEAAPVEHVLVLVPVQVAAAGGIGCGRRREDWVAEASHRECGYERSKALQRYEMPIVMVRRDPVACAQTLSGKVAVPVYSFPIASGLLAAAPPGGCRYGRWDWAPGSFDCAALPRVLLFTASREIPIAAQLQKPQRLVIVEVKKEVPDSLQDCLYTKGFHATVILGDKRQIEQSRKRQDLNPRVVTDHSCGANAGKNWPYVDGGNNSTGILRRKKICSGRKHHFSSLRFWIIVLLVSMGVNSVDGQTCGANHNFCPAPRGQYKRVLKGDFCTSEEALCKDSEHKESKKKGEECRDTGVDEKIARAAGVIFTFIANMGPIVVVKRISQVSPHREQMLCRTSAFFAASSFIWLIYLGPDNCLNWPSYISITVACSLHGYFCWFFWQQTHPASSLQSASVLIGSLILTSLTAFIATTTTQSFLDMSITSTVVGLLGLLFTVLAVYYRTQSVAERPDGNLDVNVVTAFLGTASFLYCLQWWDYKLHMFSTKFIFFKIGVAILMVSRSCEFVQLIWFHSTRERDAVGQNNVPLLQPDVTIDSEVTASTSNARTVERSLLAPDIPSDSESTASSTDARNGAGVTVDGANRGNTLISVPYQSDGNGESEQMESKTENSNGTSLPNVNDRERLIK